jgi:hypothetical protein
VFRQYEHSRMVRIVCDALLARVGAHPPIVRPPARTLTLLQTFTRGSKMLNFIGARIRVTLADRRVARAPREAGRARLPRPHLSAIALLLLNQPLPGNREIGAPVYICRRGRTCVLRRCAVPFGLPGDAAVTRELGVGLARPSTRGQRTEWRLLESVAVARSGIPLLTEPPDAEAARVVSVLDSGLSSALARAVWIVRGLGWCPLPPSSCLFQVAPPSSLCCAVLLPLPVGRSRTLAGTFMAFDRHMNLVLGETEEWRRLRVKNAAGKSECWWCGSAA